MPSVSSLLNSHRHFLIWQLSITASLVLLLIVGDRSAPKLLNSPTRLTIQQPYTLQFDRAVDKTIFEQSFQLSQNNQPAKGVFSWSSRSVAFIPDQPFHYDQQYQLNFTLADAHNTQQQASHTYQLQSSPARFLYLTPNKELWLYNLSTSQTRQLSLPNQRVLDYDVATTGRIIVSYQITATDNGLSTIELDDQDKPRYTTLWTSPDQSFLISRFCNNSSSLLLYQEPHLANPNGYQNNRLLTVSNLGSTINLDQAQAVGPTQLSFPNDNYHCAHRQDALWITQIEPSNMILTSLSASTSYPLGQKRLFYGFTPKTDHLLMDQYLEGAQGNLHALLLFDPQTGNTTTYQDPDYHLSDAQFNPQETILATVALDSHIPIGQANQSQLHLYQTDSFGLLALTPIQIGFNQQFPNWSPDSQYLAYQAIAQDLSVYPLISGSITNQSLNGYIQLIKDPLNQGPQLTSQNTRLQGGYIKWLP